MSFNSIQFLIYLPLVLIGYFSISYRFRWAFLLAASYLFYMWWEPAYLLLILFSTAVDYAVGCGLDRTSHPKRRKILLLMSVVSNLGLLFFFKYFNFFAQSFNLIFSGIHLNLSLPQSHFLLPVGISFYTFQTLSYSIDIYRKEIKHEKHYGVYSLYVAFFPQLVAGPIERAKHLLGQLKNRNDFDYHRTTHGLKLVLWGLFKKVVIADRLAIFVDQVYQSPTSYVGIPLIIATVFFAFQIYCDFSGYSDIAIGVAQAFNVNLINNFRWPYHATSVKDFWSRWHISLTSWFKDYLYIPLGGNRVSVARWQVNIAITFLLSGLWHGANWTFLIWGGLHGLYVVVEQLSEKVRHRFVEFIGLNNVPFLKKTLARLITFFLVCLAWVFFRAESLSDAFYICTHLTTGIPEYLSKLSDDVFRKWYLYMGFSGKEFWLAIIGVVILELVHFIQRRGPVRERISRMPTWGRWMIYVSAALIIMNHGVIRKIPFIYFQF